jgi:hypothetical protein
MAIHWMNTPGFLEAVSGYIIVWLGHGCKCLIGWVVRLQRRKAVHRGHQTKGGIFNENGMNGKSMENKSSSYRCATSYLCVDLYQCIYPGISNGVVPGTSWTPTFHSEFVLMSLPYIIFQQLHYNWIQLYTNMWESCYMFRPVSGRYSTKMYSG